MLNDWGIGKFLTVVLAVSLVTFASIALDIPVLRQVSALIFLSLLPGVLILRVLRVHRISPIESILYSVGLSLAFLMLIGLLMNILYPAIGISRPISTLPLIITIGILLLILCLLSYWRDRDFSNPNPPNLKAKNIFSPPVLFLLLLPVLSALGAYMVNFYGNIILLLFVIAMIAVTVLLVALNRFIPRELYPLAILMIAISLLFHTSLISSSLVGYDSRIEYFFYKAVETNAHWDSTVPYAIPTNAMLSTTILPAILTSQLGIEGMPLFKIIYQLFFALMPLALYQAFRTQVSDRTAFLSAVLAMSYFEFFGEMPAILKQEIATLFMALSILVMLNRTMGVLRARLLLITFGAMVVVSHYAASYLFMFWIVLALPLLYWLRYEEKVFSMRYTMLFVVIAFSWYMLTTEATTLRTVLNIGKHIYFSLNTELFAPEATSIGGRLALPPQTLLRLIGRIWFITFYFFMAVGILRLVFDRKKVKFYPEYTALSLASFAILCIHLFVPYSAQSFNVSRVLGISLVLLAPISIIGGEAVFSVMIKAPKLLGRPLRNLLSSFKNYLPEVGRGPGRMIFIFVIVWLLFQSEFIYAVAQKPVFASLAFNPEKDFTKFNVRDEIAAAWLAKTEEKPRVTVDTYGRALLWAYSGEQEAIMFVLNDEGNIEPPPQDAYVFLRSYNTKHNSLGVGAEMSIDLQNLDLAGRNKVYDNGDAQIYK